MKKTRRNETVSLRAPLRPALENSFSISLQSNTNGNSWAASFIPANSILIPGPQYKYAQSFKLYVFKVVSG